MKIQVGKLKVLALAAIIAVSVILTTPGISLLIGNYVISTSGSISQGPSAAGPLHTEGKYVKDSTGQVIFLRGGWVPVFEDTCNARAALPGEIWNSYTSTRTWRAEAVNTLLDEAVSWGMNSIATFIWIDWWIYNSQTELGVSRSTIVTDRPYQQNIAEFLTLAEAKGIYVQIRPYGTEAGYGGTGEGRVLFPYPAGSYTHAGHILPDRLSFANFWADVATKLAHHPNVIFNLYDEPVINNINEWFEASALSIQKIREAETAAGGYKHLIQIHWAFCGPSTWIGDWITFAQSRGVDLGNIIYSNHIYRDQGWGAEDTFGPPPYPYDYATQKAILQYKAGDPNIPDPYKPYGRAWKYIIDTYNVPIVATFGANTGWTNDQEYQSFQNVASILNEWEVGYWVYVWYRTGMIWSIVNDEPVVSSPNRVGQALIDAISAG